MKEKKPSKAEIKEIINYVTERELYRDSIVKFAYSPRVTLEGIWKAYSDGLCGNLALLLKNCFPTLKMVYFYSEKNEYEANHMLVEQDGAYFDIMGEWDENEVKQRLTKHFREPREIAIREVKDGEVVPGANKEYWDKYTNEDCRLSIQRLKELRKEQAD